MPVCVCMAVCMHIGDSVAIRHSCKDFWYKGETAVTKYSPSEARLHVRCLHMHVHTQTHHCLENIRRCTCNYLEWGVMVVMMDIIRTSVWAKDDIRRDSISIWESMLKT